MNFDKFSLDPRIHAGIKDVGFVEPTPIQEQAIPYVLDNRDVLGLAQTGTGKTAAFAIPILNRLTQGKLRQVRALVVAPTRELAEQIHESFEELGRHTRIRSITVYGGVSKNRQVQQLRRGAEIVVACPGRLLDHIGEGDIDLSKVEVLVLDEADRMCDMGFLPDIKRILKHLPKKRQTLFFSATMPDDIRTLSKEILHNPETVQIGAIAPAKTVSHALYPVTEKLKKPLLLAMLEQQTNRDQVLVFTRTKRRARNLARDLASEGYSASALQGNMSQNRRQEAINGFRDGDFEILVATDIAARGIDVAEVSHVINYDMPDTVDAYTHRIGRTGRAHQTGEAFTLTVDNDAAMIRDIEKLLGEQIERRTLSEFDYRGYKPSSSTGSNGSGSNGNNSSRRRSNGSNGSGKDHGANNKSSGNSSGSTSARHRKRRRKNSNGGSGSNGSTQGGSKGNSSNNNNSNSGGSNSPERPDRRGDRYRHRRRRNSSRSSSSA